jgi:hypothetical protein
MFKSPKKQLKTSWDAYYATIPDIRKLVRIVSENCSSVVSSGNPNDITIDDDKWRFRSENWSALGYSRQKGIKFISVCAKYGLARMLILNRFVR